MDIKFHCDSKNNFKNEQELIRAFIYTDYSIDPHNHDFYEMNIVLRGKGKHQIENACFDVTVGDVFIIPPMTVHAYFDTKNLDVYHILLQKSFIANNRSESQNVSGFIQLVEIEPFLRQHFSSEMFLHLTQSQIMQLKSDLSLIDDSVTLGKDSLKPLKNHTVWKILYWFSGLLFSQITIFHGKVNL